jgi:DNA-binding transcriptional LysR family regulator
MQWDDLQYFLAVARSGQLARAALNLRVDATTVGRRLRRLEADLGETLFEQARDGQVLTTSGERLLARVEMMERAAIDIGADRGDGRVSGVVRVSASEGFGTWFVAHHLRRFAEANPGISVDLAANSGFLSPSRRETDVAILLARPRKGPLVTRRLTDYDLQLYASHGYLTDHGPIASAQDLHDHTLIGYIPDLIYAPELRYLDEVAPGVEPRLRSSSINAQYRMAAAGAGVAVLPAFIGATDPELAVVLPDVRIRRSFWLVTHQDTRHLPHIRLFVGWITALAEERRDRLKGDRPKA